MYNNDIKRQNVTWLSQWHENASEACFEKCVENNELTFMSVQEGMCLRNCVIKLNYMIPELERRLRSSPWHDEFKKYRDYKESKGYKEPLPEKTWK